jgi:hypothetical protein
MGEVDLSSLGIATRAQRQRAAVERSAVNLEQKMLKNYQIHELK